MPTVVTNFTCSANDECAGLCPSGYYCPVGIEEPIPCPKDTYRGHPGGAAVSDCDKCPAGFLCNEGTSVPVECPAGYYCPEGNKTEPCPYLTFRNNTGAAVVTDCYPCPAGYFCNQTGI
ncbi:signal peptide, CUB and EGF-like domain-containing protein 3, partial [Mizuhopecten yessoensis]|uniref:signal peptide, CUB and EGF-like domain-containing protein 3 n=1 Tax=Mizuhopecten yessoensis TaxID=6573 RepID=UPI000B45A3F8